jgi:hypothetical protein
MRVDLKKSCLEEDWVREKKEGRRKRRGGKTEKK